MLGIQLQSVIFYLPRRRGVIGDASILRKRPAELALTNRRTRQTARRYHAGKRIGLQSIQASPQRQVSGTDLISRNGNPLVDPAASDITGIQEPVAKLPLHREVELLRIWDDDVPQLCRQRLP